MSYQPLISTGPVLCTYCCSPVCIAFFFRQEELYIEQNCLKMATGREKGIPNFCFGVIADIQYADIDDGQKNIKCYHNTRVRYYRNSVHALAQAIQFWNSREHSSDISFILNLGDTIDVRSTLNNTHINDLGKVMNEWKKYKGTVYHVWGNHELTTFKRSELLFGDLNSSPYKTNKSPEEVKNMKAYYEFSPHEKFCFIVLDTYEISIHGYEKDHPKYIEAKTILEAKNPNEIKYLQEGLSGIDRRYLSFNGALSEEQLEWLDAVIAKAQQQKKWVIVSGKYLILSS